MDGLEEEKEDKEEEEKEKKEKMGEDIFWCTQTGYRMGQCVGD